MPLIRRDPPRTGKTEQDGALASGDAQQRWTAARAMGEGAGDAAALIEALGRETTPEVQEAIFTSLVRIHTEEAARGVANFIRSDDAGMRTGAIDALGAMMDVARSLLPGLLADPDADVRLLACELVRGLQPRDVTDLLCSLIETEAQANVCGAAVDVLSEAGLSDAAGPLDRCRARFPDDPYLGFAIADAIERVATRDERDE